MGEGRLAAAAEKASSLRAHDTFDCSQRRIVVLTPRVSEDLMRYQHGEHRCGAPRAQGAWTEPISDEILFVQVLTLFNFDANVVQQQEQLCLQFMLSMTHWICIGFSRATPTAFSIMHARCTLHTTVHKSANPMPTICVVQRLQRSIYDIVRLYAHTCNAKSAATRYIDPPTSPSSFLTSLALQNPSAPR